MSHKLKLGTNLPTSLLRNDGSVCPNNLRKYLKYCRTEKVRACKFPHLFRQFAAEKECGHYSMSPDDLN